jgi:hypothetical protein
MATSFAKDIGPMFYNYAPQMAWRFDLSSYENVKTNAALIQNYITPTPAGGGNPAQPPQMPPPPYPPLSDADVALFAQWVSEQCPP